MKNELYYIQNKDAGFLGNSPVWWAKRSQGYTAYINCAEQFNKDDAESIVKGNPDKNKMFLCDHIDERLHLVFDTQDSGNLGTDNACGWSGGYAQKSIVEPTITRDMLEDYLMRPICCTQSDCGCHGVSIYNEIRQQALTDIQKPVLLPVEMIDEALQHLKSIEQYAKTNDDNKFHSLYKIESMSKMIKETLERAKGEQNDKR